MVNNNYNVVHFSQALRYYHIVILSSVYYSNQSLITLKVLEKKLLNKIINHQSLLLFIVLY